MASSSFYIDKDNQDARLYIDGELYGNSKFLEILQIQIFLLTMEINQAQNNQFMYMMK